MRIYCPKCKVGYEIDETLIPEEGKKLRCSYCREVFVAHREDLIATPVLVMSAGNATDSAKNAENEDISESGEETAASEKTEAENEEIKEIFQRLAEQSENLVKEELEMPAYKKFFLKMRSGLGLNRKGNRRLFAFVAAVLALLLLYNYRYEVVRSFPFMNSVYNLAGIKAKIPGEGLEFQNITWNPIEEGGDTKLEVKGFIYNPTDREIEIPVMRVEMLDKDAQLLQSLNQKPLLKSLQPGGRVAVGVVIKRPVPEAKYIYMTFID